MDPLKRSLSEGLKPEPDESILNLLKIMSHDIRSSLLSMLATLKLLNRGYYGEMNDEVARKINELLSSVTRLTGISEEYVGRTFTMNEEFESDSESLHPIQNILSPVLEELSQELKDRRIEIDRQLRSFLAKNTLLKGNKIWLKTIFRNLIRNAIKYSAKGCTIAIGFENRGSQCRVNVYNDGNPIPEPCRDRLFTKFGCIENSAERDGKDEGMGLGLYLIKKIIQRQGGEIWYEAKEHGSNFVFTLPTGDS
jgi:signal transduction histidine kinase